MKAVVFTIGHSTQSSAEFMQRLQLHGITAVADVRSTPYSRFNPHFNRQRLHSALNEAGIRYVFLGKELGARSEDDSCYVNDKVQYDLLARTALFQSGLSRVIEGTQDFRVALMCAEKDPLDCHRTILVARELVRLGHEVQHILGDGSVETHPQAMARLIKRLKLAEPDMFRPDEADWDEACDRQAERIAYQRKPRGISPT